MEEKTNDFFRTKYIEKKPKSEVLKILGISRKEYKELEEACKVQREARDKLYTLYKRKGFQSLPFEGFVSWINNQDPTCYYCEIHQSEIDELISQKLIFTKRTTTRGRRLELERVLPNESYNNIENLRFCCYWCNNAKSDEFTESEFKEVAQQISAIWKNRLSLSS